MAKLYFYYASMNAGKSTTLLQADFNYRERGMKTMLWTAALDDRYDRGLITSRIGLKAEANCFEPGTDLLAEIRTERARRTLACVLVDEAQFLSAEQVFQLAAVCDQLNIPVLAYGLRTDFQAKLFPGSAQLLALADTLVELKAVCECGRKATMNLRVDATALKQKSAAMTATSRSAVGTSARHYATNRVPSAIKLLHRTKNA